MARAIDTTLDQARIDPTLIDYVNAHGSGTRQNDRHETAAVKRSLGAHAHDTPMSSIKSLVGHSLGAIGAIEVVACVLALKHQVVPPTANYGEPDPACDLDVVPNAARPADVAHALSNSFAFGGLNAVREVDLDDVASKAGMSPRNSSSKPGGFACAPMSTVTFS